MVAVAVTSYGDKYLPMLVSFLESWGTRFPDIYLAIADVSDGVVEDLASSYPSVRIMSPPSSFSNDEQVRISQKMRLWRFLADQILLAEHKFAVFADADTVLVNDITDFCSGDVVITLRNAHSQFLLNTGVCGLSRDALASGFVHEWASRNEAIIGDPVMLAKATSPDHIYGGGDQMALIEMLGLSRSSGAASYKHLAVRMVSCDEYNACENTIDEDRARVIHQKASLHKFLLDRRPLTGPRKLHDSLFQLRAAIDANTSAIRRMESCNIPQVRVRKLYKFRLPRGIRDDLSMPGAVMAVHALSHRLRRVAGTIVRHVKAH